MLIYQSAERKGNAWRIRVTRREPRRYGFPVHVRKDSQKDR